ncbi:hypothetical protein HY416_03440 [Candidatus Kaiserbacteria bacterium]|nr:hypothetical protein [Candidatus Kaiserbacteria bacterium]
MTDKKSYPKNSYTESALKAGLSAKAASVYVALLEAESALAPKRIIFQTKLHRQYVYDALAELRDKRLVMAVGEGRRVKYMAASPDTLLQEAEKQRIDVRDGVGRLMQLYDRSPAGIVEIIRGSEAVLEDEFDQIRRASRGDRLDIVGGAGMNWVRLVGDRAHEWEELRNEKQVKLRYIGTTEDEHYNKYESIVKNETRTIPNIGDIVNVVIWPWSVSFNIYQPEIVTVRVREPATVASQRALFEVLWKAAQ